MGSFSAAGRVLDESINASSVEAGEEGSLLYLLVRYT